MFKTIWNWTLLSSLVFIIACQTMQTSHTQSAPLDKPAETTALEKRLHEYFSARKSADYQRLYDLNSPAYRTEIAYKDFKESPLESLIGLSAIYILGIEFTSATSADVWLTEYSRPTGIPTNWISPNQHYRWVKKDGIWYHDRKISRSEDITLQCGGVNRERANQENSKPCGY